jgi:hypothetical protein
MDKTAEVKNSNLNANAKEWTPNPNAMEFKPFTPKPAMAGQLSQSVTPVMNPQSPPANQGGEVPRPNMQPSPAPFPHLQQPMYPYPYSHSQQFVQVPPQQMMVQGGVAYQQHPTMQPGHPQQQPQQGQQQATPQQQQQQQQQAQQQQQQQAAQKRGRPDPNRVRQHPGNSPQHNAANVQLQGPPLVSGAMMGGGMHYPGQQQHQVIYQSGDMIYPGVAQMGNQVGQIRPNYDQTFAYPSMVRAPHPNASTPTSQQGGGGVVYHNNPHQQGPLNHPIPHVPHVPVVYSMTAPNQGPISHMQPHPGMHYRQPIPQQGQVGGQVGYQGQVQPQSQQSQQHG